MSDQIFRRSPSIRSRNFQPSAGNSPQNSPRRRTPTNRNRLALPRKRILPERVLSRTYSDSFLLKSSDLEVVAVEDCGYDRSPVPETEEGSLFPGLLRQHYFAYEKDVSLSSVSMNNLFAGRSYSFRNEKYNDDTKLGLNVHVEGSSGPIKVKMKMGDTAEGMIKGVLAQYALESRWPALECDSNGYELHYSRHDLEGICRSAKIGDLYLGTRSFYL